MPARMQAARRLGTPVATPAVAKSAAPTPPDPAPRRRRASGGSRYGTVSAAGGGFDGARFDLRETATWHPGGGSADRDALPDLPTLRARSRDLIRNAPIAKGVEVTKLNNIVGTGLVPEPAIDRAALGLDDDAADAWEDQAKAVVKRHLGTPRCDIRRNQTFGGLQQLVLRSAIGSGDCFVLRRSIPRPGDILALKLQVIEADRVASPYLARYGDLDDDHLRDGVELDDDGQPIAYRVLAKHPGGRVQAGLAAWGMNGALAGGDWTRVARFGADSGELQVAHVFDPERPEQTRGIPALATVVVMLKQLSRHAEAELAAHVITSFFTVFLTTQDEAGEPGEEEAADSIADALGFRQGADLADPVLGHGTIARLRPGESITSANLQRPGAQYEPFVTAILRQVGVAADIPYELLVKHFTASYSASRAALIEAWRGFVRSQQWLVDTFCQPTYEWALSEAIARGLLRAPGFFEDPVLRHAWCGCSWYGPTMGQLNPLDEAKAQEVRLKNRLTSRTRESAQSGLGTWSTNARMLAKEKRILDAAGLGTVDEIPKGGEGDSTTPGSPTSSPTPDQADAAEQADTTDATDGQDA